MKLHSLTPQEHLKAVGIGVIVAVLLSAVMVPAFKLGISPMPKPLGLAFAETILPGEPQTEGQGQAPQQSRPQQAQQAGEQAQQGSQQAQQGGQQGSQAQQPGGGGKGLPLPVGLAFHLVYVAFWSWLFVVLLPGPADLPERLSAGRLSLLVVFFPVVGWGFLGLEVSPKLIVASAVPHLLFAIFLWGVCSLSFSRPRVANAGGGSYSHPAR